MPLSLTLTLPGGHKVSAKQNLLFLFSHTFFICTFHLIRMKFDMLIEQLKLNILRLLLNKTLGNKGNTPVLQTV